MQQIAQPAIGIFDTETSGLAKGFPQYTKTEEYDSCRLVEFGMKVYDENQNFMKQINFLIKPEGFVLKELKEGDQKINDITQELLDNEGIPIQEGLEIIYNNIKPLKVLVAHNIRFDVNVLKAEAYRAGYQQLIDVVESVEQQCLMRIAKHTFEYQKFPKLNALYDSMIGEEIVQTHRAIDDIILTERVYFKLMKDKNYAKKLPKVLRYNIDDYMIQKGDYKGLKIQQAFEQCPEYLQQVLREGPEWLKIPDKSEKKQEIELYQILKSITEDTKFLFGKHIGKTFKQVYETDSRYLGWINTQVPYQNESEISTQFKWVQFLVRFYWFQYVIYIPGKYQGSTIEDVYRKDNFLWMNIGDSKELKEKIQKYRDYQKEQQQKRYYKRKHFEQQEEDSY